MLYQLNCIPLKAQGPFLPQCLTCPTSVIQSANNVFHTESDALVVGDLNRAINVSTRDGDDPALFYRVVNATTNAVLNTNIISLPSDALNCDVSLAFDKVNNQCYAVVVYNQVSTNGITLEYYRFDSSSDDLDNSPCTSDYVVTSDLVANTINIDTDDNGNFLVVADLYIGAVTNQRTGLVLIPGTIYEGTATGCIDPGYSPGVNEECITYIRPPSEEDDLAWPDVSLSENYWYGGPIFVDNVSAVITYQVGASPAHHIEVIVAPEFPCFDYLKENQLESLAELATTTGYYADEPYYRYFQFNDSHFSGSDMLHPRISSLVGTDVTWQVVCESQESGRSDIYMFDEDISDPADYDFVHVTEPTGSGLISETDILNFNSYFPQLSRSEVNQYTNVFFDVDEDDIPITKNYSIALRMDGIVNAVKFDGANGAPPVDDFTHFDENSDYQRGASVGRRFGGSNMFYSCYNFDEDEWQFKYPSTAKFRANDPFFGADDTSLDTPIAIKIPELLNSILIYSAERVNYQIYDVTGKVIFRGELDASNAKQEIINWSKLLKGGLYLLSTSNHSGIIRSQKLVKL